MFGSLPIHYSFQHLNILSCWLLAGDKKSRYAAASHFNDSGPRATSLPAAALSSCCFRGLGLIGSRLIDTCCFLCLDICQFKFRSVSTFETIIKSCWLVTRNLKSVYAAVPHFIMVQDHKPSCSCAVITLSSRIGNRVIDACFFVFRYLPISFEPVSTFET